MSKATQMLFILSIIMAGLFIAGISGSGGNLLSIIQHPSTFLTSGIFAQIEAMLLLFGTIAGVVVGLVFPIKLEQIVTAAVTITLIEFGLECMHVFSILQQTSLTLALVIAGPVELLVLLTMLEWWRSGGTS
jgi:hypothetical protein